MKKLMLLSALTLATGVAGAADLSAVSSLLCAQKTVGLSASYSQATQTLEITKNGETKTFQITKASGGGDLSLVLTGSSSVYGDVQVNLAADGTEMIYQVATGEVDYLNCQTLP